MTSGLARYLEEQRAFQQQLERFNPQEPGERGQVERIQRLALSVHGELDELLHELGYKLHYRRPRPDWDNAREEWVDCLKYLLQIAERAGWTAVELDETFWAKSAVVRERLDRQMRELTERPVAVFDLDGVLCEATLWDDEETEEERCRRGVFRDQVPVPFMLGFLPVVQSWGMEVILVTSRKAHRWKRIVADTELWLREHRVAFDDLVFTVDKTDAVVGRNVVFAVEDSTKHALDYAMQGIRTFGVLSEFHDDIPARPSHQLLSWHARGPGLCAEIADYIRTKEGETGEREEAAAG